MFKKFKPQKSAPAESTETTPESSYSDTTPAAEETSSEASSYQPAWQPPATTTPSYSSGHSAPSYSSSMSSTNRNVLSSDVEIKGSITFQNELVIDGKIEGEITSDGVLTVGENAEITGEIRTRSVTVHGRVNGNISVQERCELQAKSTLIGDLSAARLSIEEGATFVGKSDVNPNRVDVASPEPAVIVEEEDSSDKITSFGSR